MTHPPGKPSVRVRGFEKKLRDIAMAYPEAHEDFPWGERAIKVKGKVFLFMYAGEGGLSLSTKLPASHHVALTLPFAKPTGYGLGKSGWVTARFAPSETPPVEMLAEWVDESYRAVAPKKLVAMLDAASVPSPTGRKKPTAKKPASTKPATKKPAAKKPAAKKPAAKRR